MTVLPLRAGLWHKSGYNTQFRSLDKTQSWAQGKTGERQRQGNGHGRTEKRQRQGQGRTGQGRT